jgi:hypothetical protein
MKKIKKLVLVCASLITIVLFSCPALAGTRFTYEKESQILNFLGLYEGTSTISFNPDLAAQVDRETGITLVVKLFGKRNDAMAMTYFEAESILSNFSDKNDISNWAKKYIALAVKSGMIQGDSPTTISPKKPVDGRSYATMLLRNLGYDIDADDWKSALDILSEKGGLSPKDVKKFQKPMLTKDDIVGITYSALNARTSKGISLLQLLIDKNVVKLQDAQKVGLIDVSDPGKLYAPTDRDLVYYAIKNALLRAADEVNLSKYPASNSNEAVFSIINQVVNDNPEILYYEGCTYWSNGRLQLKYRKDKATCLSHLEQLNKRVDKIIKEIIKPGMTDYEKEQAVHDYIITHARYDIENYKKGTIPPESYSAYGTLVLGTGVCEGYAKSMKLILDRLGVECLLVPGNSKGQNHVWNMVRIDGDYYHVDITWNDPVFSDGTDLLIYDYFNLTDSEMAKDHSWDTKAYPSCSSTKYNYFYYNNLVVSKYSEFYDRIKSAMAAGLRNLTLKILDFGENTYNVVSTVNKAARELAAAKFTNYYYSINEAIGVVEIIFE